MKIFAGKPRHGRGRYPARGCSPLLWSLLFSLLLLPLPAAWHDDFSKSRNDPAGSSDEAIKPHPTTKPHCPAAPSLCQAKTGCSRGG